MGHSDVKKTWFGLVLLSSSWLWGLEVLHDAHVGWWLAMVLTGLCLVRAPKALVMTRKTAWLCLCFASTRRSPLLIAAASLW